MLVLTRRVGETIIIDNNVRVTLVSVGPGRVKIGIEAPPNVRIDREEIHDKISQEQTATTADEPLHVGEEAPKLHNRIAGKLPAVEAAASPVAAGPAPSTPAERMERFRRKPR